MIPIVLTGTIVPNAVFTAHSDSVKRRNEYLNAIDFYSRFSDIYFLENSSYDLHSDAEFYLHPNVKCIKYPSSPHFDKGKGYQEFEMLDGFVANSLSEDAFIKITGRYIYTNFAQIYANASENSLHYDAIIDAKQWAHKALTSLFFITKDAYRRSISGAYLEMNDSQGVWAEHAIYNRLKKLSSYTFFKNRPMLKCIDGSMGKKVDPSSHHARRIANSIERFVMRRLGKRKLIY